MREDRWILEALFKNEAEVQGFLSNLEKAAKEFEKTFKGHLNHQQEFCNVLVEYERLVEGIASVQTYAFLLFAQDSHQGDVYAKYELITNQIQSYLLFFELEFCALPSLIQQEYIQACPSHRFYLEQLISKKAYQLSLEQEQIVLDLSPVGVGAFSRFFDEHLSQMKLCFKDGKRRKMIGEEEVLAYLHHSDRRKRKQAQKVFTKELKKSRHFLTFVLNMVRKDLSIFTKLRGYPNKESFRHIDNCTTQKSVDSLVEVVEKNYSLVRLYYGEKKELLGIKKLKDYDRYAPIQIKKEEHVDYEDGLEWVLDSFEKFSPVFAEIARRALQEGWVDSHPRERKRGGAFSHGATPLAHPYVMLNFTGCRRDVFTIAHEFGHMIHQELSKTQGFLNMDTPLTTAETASVFAEMLLFDTLKENLSSKELLSLYASKIEDIFSTLFRQIVMTKFERAIHRIEGELKSEDFDRIWLEENEKMFQGSLKLTKNYALWWSYIPHFVHSPFYCYAYSYGQLLVLALFGLYKDAVKQGKKEEFVERYVEFLSLGGSKSPREMIAKFGFDVEKADFWQIGMREIENLLQEFCVLKNQVFKGKK